jgi:hypothetical protein
VDVLKLLAKFSWRGEIYPISSRQVSFRHEGIEHTIQYRDFDFIEQLGAHGLTFRYTIPNRQNIAKGPYKQMFADGYPRLFRDMQDRTAGTLFDPLLNRIFQCVPSSWDDTTDPRKRDGTDVQVEFRHSPPLTEEDPQTVDATTVAGLTSEAGALDAEVAKADWKQEVPPEPSIDPLNFATGVVAQGLAQIQKVSASLQDFAYKMEKIEQTCDAAENPENWGIRDAARRNRESAIRLNRRLKEDPATKLRTFTTRTRALISDVASDAGMTIEELLSLNPALARLPYVPLGAVVVVRARAA